MWHEIMIAFCVAVFLQSFVEIRSLSVLMTSSSCAHEHVFLCIVSIVYQILHIAFHVPGNHELYNFDWNDLRNRLTDPARCTLNAT